jgi:hypothetical protein
VKEERAVTGLLRIGIAALLLLGACGRKSDATRPHFEDAMRAYLERRGDICLTRTTWPIDVTPRDVAMGSRDAVQMPVFERLGLVRSSDATVDVVTDDGAIPVPVRRYELTEAGLRDYRSHEIGVNESGEKVAVSDLCAAKLSLAKVVGWDVATTATPGEPPRAVVSYTYEVAADAWTRDPEIQRVLPAVARVIAGAGAAELKESFVLTASGWVALELLPGEVRVVDNPPRLAAPGNP